MRLFEYYLSFLLIILYLPETVYASFSGLITFPWNQLPSRANANVAWMVVCDHIFITIINCDKFEPKYNNPSILEALLFSGVTL